MKNYWLECVVKQKKAVPSWDLKRVQLLESLIKPTAQFSVELDNHLAPPSILDCDSIIEEHASGTCDPTKVGAWVYVNLLRKAVQDANAVALLRSKSLPNQAINLWRSLFETDVVSQYVGDRLSKDHHLPCRYAIQSIVRPTVRRWEEFNEACRRRGKPAYYSAKEIKRRKDLYGELIGKWREDYAWTNEPSHKTFKAIAQATNSDMLFHRIANNEVHPTFGEAAVVTDSRLPLPAVPLLPVGIAHDAGELSLEFQTAKSLSNTTRRVTDYTTLTGHLQDRLTGLEELAEGVLRDLT